MLRPFLSHTMRNACAMAALSLLCAGLLAQQNSGQVYKSVDDKGRIIFTDKPPKDRPSESFKVPATNSAPATQKTDTSTASANQPESAEIEYTRFVIANPADNQALDYDITALDVSVIVEPVLQEDHKVHFFIDGQSYGKPSVVLERHLTDLTRGAHTVEARLRDKNGKMLMSTGLVRFYVRRSSDLENREYDGEYDYPYNQRGFRGPRGADSAGSAGEPGGAESNPGAESIDGAQSPQAPIVRARPRRR